MANNDNSVYEVASWRALLALALLLTAILLGVLCRMEGPPAKPASAPNEEFSATRAIATLRTVIGDAGSSHAVTLPEHAAVRDRIAARFRALGYDTRIASGPACNPELSCAPVENIVARAPGSTAGDVLMLTAHYDSVPAGPGASDDGVGVATLLETARAIRGEHFRNPVLFVVTDAEEAGLIGAEGIAADAAISGPVAAVINVENRGTSGLSILFETSRHNLWLIRHVAHALARPVANSLSYTIYELLPNDTDLTVFKRGGKAGINFASIGSVWYYHTPSDDLQHVDPRSVQHHGDNALAMTRELANAELRPAETPNAVYFDLFAWTLFWWPQGWTFAIAIIVFGTIVVAAFLHMRARRLEPRAVTLGVVAFFLALGIAGLAGFLIARLAAMRSEQTFWVAQPLMSIAATWLAGALGALLAALLVRRRAGFDGLYFGIALSWSALSFAIALEFPGAVYLALVPAAAFAVGSILRARGASATTVTLIAVALPAALLMPVALLIYIAMGAPLLAGVAVIIGLLSTSFAPLIANTSRNAGNATVITFALAAVALAIVATTLPAYTHERPRHLSFSYQFDAATKQAYWIAGSLVPAVRKAAPFEERGGLAPWVPNLRSLAAIAPDLHFAVPAVRSSITPTTGGRVVHLHAMTLRGANRISLLIHSTGKISMIRVDGVAPPPQTERHGSSGLAAGWTRVSMRASSVDVDLTLQGAAPIEVVAVDTSYGLPAGGAPLARARDAAGCVPSDEGDVTVIRSAPIVL